MNNKLNLLISLYEAEKRQLQKLIDECLTEAEYLMAHYHSQALYQLNGRLQTLHNIDDKLYDEKEFRQRIINHLQREVEAEGSDVMREYLENELQREKEALEKLNQIAKRTTSPDNANLLDEILKDLLDGKIKNLKLILKKTDKLWLAFSYSDKTLKITLPYVKQLTKQWILYDDTIRSFKNLGFEPVRNETKLVLMLTGSKENILNTVQRILSKIIFEIFYFKEFDNDSYIEFTEKRGR